MSDAFGPWLLAGGGLAAVAGVAGLVPARLMREALDGDWTREDGQRVAATALAVGLLVLAALAGAGSPDWPTACALAAVGVILTAVAVLDAKALVVADLHVAMLIALALVGPLAQAWTLALAGAVVGGGLLWVVRWAFRRVRGVEGLGLGDVKLMAALGALTGPEAVLWIVVGGAVLGLAWALARRRRGRDAEPLAVPLAAACAAPAMALLLLKALRP